MSTQNPDQLSLLPSAPWGEGVQRQQDFNELGAAIDADLTRCAKAALDDMAAQFSGDKIAPHAPQSGTSREAARSRMRGLGKLQRRYVDVVRAHGPLTDHEAALRLGVPLSSINARRNEVARFDPPLVVASAVTRRSQYGKWCTAWRWNPAASEEVLR